MSFVDIATIKNKIMTILRADTDLDTDAVFDYEPNLSEIQKDPFATLVVSGNSSDFLSTNENMRSFGFKISIFIERQQRGVDTAETLMGAMISRILGALDDDYTLTGTVLTSRAAPSEWGYANETKEYRVGTISFEVRTDYTLTA
jgi:hypothetical protein